MSFFHEGIRKLPDRWQKVIERVCFMIVFLSIYKVIYIYIYIYINSRAIRSTLDDEATAQHTILLQQLCERSKGVIRELDGSNDLTFLRLRTKKNEIMIAPDKDYLLAGDSNERQVEQQTKVKKISDHYVNSFIIYEMYNKILNYIYYLFLSMKSDQMRVAEEERRKTLNEETKHFDCTIEHELALKHKYELDKIEAETRARAKAARENRDVNLEQMKLHEEENRKTVQYFFMLNNNCILYVYFKYVVKLIRNYLFFIILKYCQIWYDDQERIFRITFRSNSCSLNL
uniref:Robl_LC7 domain-containing protein n=1 Tax=Heterorhabditis bacteriophora TaxID=37862 RepID=A0A1I7X574_HETBA